MNAIQIKNITKRYKDVTALDDISFSFEFGRIYGFLGRNGAGKSTLINIIANRIFADQGEVLIDGIPAKENMGVHEKIFCMSEADLYDRDLKVKDHFKWTNRFYNDFDLDKAFELSKKFNLDINKRFKALSKGYQSIFKLIIAVNVAAGLTGSSSGGLSIALENMQDYFLGLGLSPNVIHRIGAMSSGGLDSMPHVSGFVNNLQVCRLNHRQSYPSYAMVCLVIPIVTTCACAVLLQLGILPAV